MSTVSGGPPGASRAGGYDPTVDRGGSTQPVAATSRTARIFNEGLRKLTEMRYDAADKGEVVVNDRVSIEFERQGTILAARSAEAKFESLEPHLAAAAEPPTPVVQTTVAPATGTAVPQAPAPAPTAVHTTAKAPEHSPPTHDVPRLDTHV